MLACELLYPVVYIEHFDSVRSIPVSYMLHRPTIVLLMLHVLLAMYFLLVYTAN